MSPIIGLFVALIAAWLATGPRAAAAMVVPPMLGATAAQSWYLGTGRGHNSAAQTTNSPAYWVVQVIIVVQIILLFLLQIIDQTHQTKET